MKGLPDVWVSWNLGVPWIEDVKGKNDAVRYTPAKPTKVCRWKDDSEFWIVGCKQFSIQGDAQTYCPYCGGKIKVTR